MVILMLKTSGNFSGFFMDASIGKIKPIPSKDVTATPISMDHELGLKALMLGPKPLFNN